MQTNALASVVASIVAVIVSMNWGSTATLLCGAVCYIGAGVFSLARSWRSEPGSPEDSATVSLT